MGKYTIVELVVGMLNLGATAIGYALDIKEITHISANWWPLITLSIGILLVAWVIYDNNKQISKLLDARPSICVQILNESHIYYLKIHNNGARGTFEAQIKLSSDDPSVSGFLPYKGYWKNEGKDKSPILNGQDDLLKIAELDSSEVPGGTSQSLKIWYFDPSVNVAYHISTSNYWPGGYIRHPDGSTTAMTKHEYRICVNISSDPKLKEGNFKANYILDFNGLKVDSNSQSISHKKSSQNY